MVKNGKENGNYQSILGLYRDNVKNGKEGFEVQGFYRENGKENGNYRDYRDYIGYLLGFYKDNGKENGNYQSTLGLYTDNGEANCCSI